jgi:hypothetical protein
MQRDVQVLVVHVRHRDLAAGNLEVDTRAVLLALAPMPRRQLEATPETWRCAAPFTP